MSFENYMHKSLVCFSKLKTWEGYSTAAFISLRGSITSATVITYMPRRVARISSWGEAEARGSEGRALGDFQQKLRIFRHKFLLYNML